MSRGHGRTRVRMPLVAAIAGTLLVLSGGVSLAAFTSSVSGATDFTTRDLLAPSGVTATGSCSTTLEATLTWTAGSSWADGQEIWRSTTAGSDGIRLATAAATATSYADSTVSSGTTYYYRVKSVKVNWVESSAEATFVCA